jgi:ferredoxin
MLPSGRVTRARAGETLLVACNRIPLPLGQSCSGVGLCGWCRVLVVAGRENLAGQAKAMGDVVITTTYW